MTEPDALGMAFGSDFAALIGIGASAAFRGETGCTAFGSNQCRQDRAQIAVVLASGIIGYPLGLLYPRNARYHVTAGDINALWSGAIVGALTGAAFLPESPKRGVAATAVTGGMILGVI